MKATGEKMAAFAKAVPPHRLAKLVMLCDMGIITRAEAVACIRYMRAQAQGNA